MSEPLSNTALEIARWARVARRCVVTLALLLAVNFSLITWAVCGPSGAAVAEPRLTPAAVGEVANSSDTQDVQLAASLVVEMPDEESPANVTEPVQLPMEVAKVPEAISAAPAPVEVQPIQVEVKEPPVENFTIAADSLYIINPPATGGPVSFTVDDEAICLNPGEYLERTSDHKLRIEFHRGGDFADAEYRWQTGAYVFRVGDLGWDLHSLDPKAARRLLNACCPLEN